MWKGSNLLNEGQHNIKIQILATIFHFLSVEFLNYSNIEMV